MGAYIYTMFRTYIFRNTRRTAITTHATRHLFFGIVIHIHPQPQLNNKQKEDNYEL